MQSNEELDFENKLPISTPSLEGFEAVLLFPSHSNSPWEMVA